MSSWKTWLILALLAVIVFLCYPRPSTSIDEGKTTIVYWGPLRDNEAIRTAIEEFERLHPQYRVEIGTATHRESIGDMTRYLLGVAGGQPPDVMNINRLSAVELGARGAFADLNPFIERDRVRLAEIENSLRGRNSPDPEDAALVQEYADLRDRIRREDYYTPIWDETTYQDHQYAISYQANVRALYLNDDYLIRAGFTDDQKTPRPPRNWEDICRKLFHGTGTVTTQGVVRLAATPASTSALAQAAPSRPIAANDVVTIASGGRFFRARIKAVNSDGSLQIDFTRDLAPDITSLPAAFTAAAAPEIKVFDANCYAVALTRFDDKGNISILGFTPLGGNSWLLNYGWQAGGDLLSTDGRTATFNDPRIQQALQFMVDSCDSMGGYQRTRAFEDALNSGDERAPFITGRLAMIVNGSWFLNYIAIFRNDFRFTAVAPPVPQARLDAGHKPFTWVGGAAHVIPAGARNVEGGWKLLSFISSRRGRQIAYDVASERYRAAGQLFVPDLACRNDMLLWLRQTYLAGNPAVSTSVLRGFDVNASLLPTAMYREPTPVSNQLFDAQAEAAETALTHLATPAEALTRRNTSVQEAIDKYFSPRTGPVVQWKYLILGYATILAIIAVLLVRSEIHRRKAGFGRRDWKAGFTCASPWLVGFIVFGGGPILFSLIISFCRYDILHPAQFVGLDNYIQLLGFHTNALGQTVANDPRLYRSLANTAFMLISLPLSIVLGLFLAMLLANELRGIAIFRTLFYLPHVVPAIASFLLWLWVFNPTRGLLNTSLAAVGIDHPPLWLSDASWAKPAIILMGLWGVGGGMLIWLAGLKSIPLQLYEAADIDGAGSFRKFFNVTLPMLSPYIFFNVVMGIIGTLQVFEAAFVMTDGGPQDSTLFYAYYLFNKAFRHLDMGAASAMAWILFLIVLALTLLQLKLSKKWVHYD